LTKIPPIQTRREAAEAIAIQALAYLAGEPERLGRFLALSGLEATDIRAAAAQPGFLAGVLDHIAGDEVLLTAFASEAGIGPAEVARAHAELTGGVWQQDVP
jgi:hypothetical protein